jgi:hypothetical protein
MKPALRFDPVKGTATKAVLRQSVARYLAESA